MARAFFLWVGALEWVFEAHTLLIPARHFPLPQLTRVAILLGVLFMGFIVAVFTKKTLRYLFLLALASIWPFAFAAIAVFAVLTAPLVLHQTRARVARSLRPLGRFLVTTTGKALTGFGLLCLVASIAFTRSAAGLAIESAVLLLLLLAFLGGFLHTAANPLLLVKAWHFVQMYTIVQMKKLVGWVGSRGKGNMPADFLAGMAAFMVVQVAHLREKPNTWKHLCAFLAWFLVAICASTFAFAALHHALLVLMPVGDVAGPVDFWSRVAMSIGILGGMGVPDALMYPFSIHTVLVAMELLTSFYFVALAVLAFTAKAESATMEMADSLSGRWQELLVRFVSELHTVEPIQSANAKINEAIARIWSRGYGLDSNSPPPAYRFEPTGPSVTPNSAPHSEGTPPPA